MLVQADVVEDEMASRGGDDTNQKTGEPGRKESPGDVDDRIAACGSRGSEDRSEPQAPMPDVPSHPESDSGILARMELEREGEVVARLVVPG